MSPLNRAKTAIIIMYIGFDTTWKHKEAQVREDDFAESRNRVVAEEDPGLHLLLPVPWAQIVKSSRQEEEYLRQTWGESKQTRAQLEKKELTGSSVSKQRVSRMFVSIETYSKNH